MPMTAAEPSLEALSTTITCLKATDCPNRESKFCFKNGSELKLTTTALISTWQLIFQISPWILDQPQQLPALLETLQDEIKVIIGVGGGK